MHARGQGDTVTRGHGDMGTRGSELDGTQCRPYPLQLENK